MTELKNRGVEDVLITVVDGLKGFPEAITAVFPDAMVQTCIVHLLRHSLEFVAYKDRKAVAAALKEIYRAVDATAGEAALAAFEEGPWGRKYAAIAPSWRRAWGEVVPFYAFPGEVRRLLYTTNAIEALNSKLRRAVRARGHFPTDEAALKLLFLVTPPTGQNQHQKRTFDVLPNPDIFTRYRQAAVPVLEPIGERVDHAGARVVHGQGPVRHPLRRALHTSHGLNRINRPTHTRKFRYCQLCQDEPREHGASVLLSR